MIDKSLAFTVRRARLLLGMTLPEFASLYGVDEKQACRWECGIDHPKPEIWARIRSLTLKAYPLLDDELIEASPVYKYIADMKDLPHPVIASRAITEVLAAVGASEAQEKPFDVADLDRNSPDYQISGLRALEIIQSDPDWPRGGIV